VLAVTLSKIATQEYNPLENTQKLWIENLIDSIKSNKFPLPITIISILNSLLMAFLRTAAWPEAN
jgi:hypothetical protein